MSALAGQVYEHLLRSRCASARDLARILRVDAGSVDRALRELCETGLVHPWRADVPGYVPGAGVGPSGVAETRFVALAPVPSLGAELQDRVVELVRAGAAVEELGHLYALRPDASVATPDLATTVSGVQAVERAAHDLVEAAHGELLSLDRQPFVRSSRPQVLPAAMFDLLRRGVPVRTIYAGDAFRVAGYADYMAELARLGEQARHVAQLPMRFVVADRTVAMLPLEADGPWVSAALVVRGPAVVGDLLQVFEELWDRAEPGRPGPADDAGVQTAELTGYEITLLRMLAEDMTEGAIGRHVGASARTVGRRLARLQHKLGAGNRFALGVEAARRGLL